MATFFGEVIHPSSRAFWNDDDDDDLPDYYDQETKLSTEWIEPKPTEIQNFLIIEGQMVIDFVETYLFEDATVLCTIGCDAQANLSKVYKIGDFYICVVNKKINLAQAGQFAEQIISILKISKNVYTLISDHISHFKGEEVNSVSFLRALYSRKARSSTNSRIPILNQPNIVTGVCAGVLSFAETANLPCSMYILYTDTFILDSKNSLPLIELLSNLLGITLPKILTGGSSFFNKGNLYM